MGKHKVDFNAEDYRPREDRSGVPDGRYLVQITDAEDKDTKTGGVGIAMRLQVVESETGEFIGAKLDHFLNIPRGPAEEDNEKIQERIFAETWKAIEPDAIGNVFDTEDWIDRQVVVLVRNKKKPWTRTNSFTGVEETTMVERSLISVFYPGSEWVKGKRKPVSTDSAATGGNNKSMETKSKEVAKPDPDIDFDDTAF